MLNTSTPWTAHFRSAGTYSRYLVKFSLSGIPHTSDLRVELDGKDLGWVPEPSVGFDRWHYDILRLEGLRAGEHEITFALRNVSLQGTAQLCSVEVLEYGNDSE